MPDHDNPQAVQELVREVALWCSQQIRAEQQAGVPDAQRMEQLKAELAVCGADLQSLRGAEPQEVDRIGERYAARLKELGGQ
ncbi:MULTISPECIES: hypothetical protein [unclassified Streptomyces]|uniref:hypothetical protein n=1 Tax=unclassified Streptomyces TaxID=2593676 RepID=UPI0036286D1F